MRSGERITAFVIAGSFVTLGVSTWAGAQGADPQMPKPEIFNVPTAVFRTLADIQNDQLKAVAIVPVNGIPFRPGMDVAAYDAEKRAVPLGPAASRQSTPQIQAPAPLAAIAGMNCNGTNQIDSGGFYPPDADSAVGLTQFVQVTNSNIVIWDKTPFGASGCPDPLTNPLLTSNLNGFFGYVEPGATTLFDPRVIHDDVFGRWVVAAEAFPDAAGAQLQFIAVSTSEDATAGFLVTRINTRLLTCPTCFWDFPQLGMDEDSIILTANIFNPGFSDSRWVFLNKARLYAGLALSGCFFAVSNPSWAPPKVMDLNPTTFMVEAGPGSSVAPSTRLILAGVTSTDRICPMIAPFQSVTVPPYSVPPDASQPFSNQLLDTSDNRFQNRSLQIGNDLWQVHAKRNGPFAGLQFYRIAISTGTVAQTGAYATSGTSFDFNPAITANGSGNAAMVYSSTDPALGIQAEVRVAGKPSALATFGPSTMVFRSSAPLSGNPSDPADPTVLTQRWGDYSGITVDPLNASLVWGVNETIDPTDPSPGTSWGTRFFNATFP